MYCYTGSLTDDQGTYGEARPRDLPFLVGFGDEAEAMLAVIGIPSDNRLPTSALAGVIVNALLGIREGKWTSYSRRHDFYNHLDRYHGLLRCKLTIDAVDRAEKMGLIERELGQRGRDGAPGLQSRFRATQRLVDLLEGHRLLNKSHFIRPVLREVLQLSHPVTGALMPYRETAKTRRMRQEILAHNADLSRHNITIRDPRVVRLGDGLLEVPTKDGGDTFLIRERTDYCRQFTGSWDMHGRCYGPHWQSLPKPVRETLGIDGGDVRRLDYGNSHHRIACAEAGYDPGLEDAYRIGGYETEKGRDLIKAATNVAINAPSRTKAVNRIAYDLACEDRMLEVGSTVGAKIGPDEMGKATRAIEAVERRHPALSKIFYTGAGLRFMAIEADVMMNVVKAARRFDIPVLSIHDEAVFPADREAKLEAIMHDEWRKMIAVPALVRA